jgi:hypothetical protein
LKAQPSASAVEAFDLPVGLGPVGAGLLGDNAELGADITPQVRAVAAAVVGENSLNDHPALGKPGHGTTEDSSGRLFGFVVVDLDVGDPGVVIDDGVDEGGAHLGVTPLIARLVWRCLLVSSPGRDEASPMPAEPYWRYRSAHRFAVGQDTS